MRLNNYCFVNGIAWCIGVLKKTKDCPRNGSKERHNKWKRREAKTMERVREREGKELYIKRHGSRECKARREEHSTIQNRKKSINSFKLLTYPVIRSSVSDSQTRNDDQSKNAL